MNNQHLVSAIWNLDIANPTTKYVLVAIARNATRDGIARTSIEKLVSCTSLDIVDVYKSILELQKNGWLVLQQGPDAVIQPPSEPNEHLTRLVESSETDNRDYMCLEVPHELWFFCINKRPRQVEPTRAAVG